jgi:hypothetical protein
MGSRSFHPLRHLRRLYRCQEALKSSLVQDSGDGQRVDEMERWDLLVDGKGWGHSDDTD